MSESENKNFNVKFDRNSYILIVDDDDTLLKFFKIHLNKYFSKVIVVKSAKEAVEFCAKNHIDLIISDINMPKIDGFQLLKKVKKFDGAIPVLLISGVISEEDEKLLSTEADGFMRKPFDVDQLHSFIDSGIEKRGLLLKLKNMLKDDHSIDRILKGKVKVESFVAKENAIEARELFDTIKSFKFK